VWAFFRYLVKSFCRQRGKAFRGRGNGNYVEYQRVLKQKFDVLLVDTGSIFVTQKCDESLTFHTETLDYAKEIFFIQKLFMSS